MTIAILPARGGSKRIPGKNYRELNGSPTICRTIQTLQDSRIFGRIVVSTDHPKIRELALSVGAEVPFQRPDELSDDHTTTKQVIQHAIHELKVSDTSTRSVCLPGGIPVESLRGASATRTNPSFIVPVQPRTNITGDANQNNMLEYLDNPFAIGRTRIVMISSMTRGNSWGDGIVPEIRLTILGTSAVPVSMKLRCDADEDTS